ncbi:MAG: NapC/NirT family cytochrome c [Desulfobacterales bacterium]|nr:NapC/NirT family cytochrome c [Desulfobacterales bacterium]
MKRYLKKLSLIAIGVLLAFPIFSITYYTMVRTSTPEFCASCHEIQFAVNTWKTSTHVNNAHGFVADCMDCHLPAPHDMFNFFYTKTIHGIKDIAAHFMKNHYDHAENREKAYSSFKNEQCMKCHRNILHIPEKRGAMLAHKTVIYPLQGYEKKCVDCHRNLVHNSTDIYIYTQYKN